MAFMGFKKDILWTICPFPQVREREREIFDKISILPKHELLYDYNVGH